MRLGKLIDFTREALVEGDATASAPVFVVLRNPEHDVDSDSGWSESGVTGLEADGGDVDLLSSVEAAPLAAADFLDRLLSLGDSGDERDVYSRGETESLGGGDTARIDVPIVAFVSNQNDDVIGLIAEFESWQDMFGPLV